MSLSALQVTAFQEFSHQNAVLITDAMEMASLNELRLLDCKYERIASLFFVIAELQCKQIMKFGSTVSPNNHVLQTHNSTYFCRPVTRLMNTRLNNCLHYVSSKFNMPCDVMVSDKLLSTQIISLPMHKTFILYRD